MTKTDLKIHKPAFPVPDFKPLDKVLIDSCGMVLYGRVLHVQWGRGGLTYYVEFTTSGYFYERYFIADELKPLPKKVKTA